VSVACPETLGETELSVALIVTGCTIRELVRIAVYLPSSCGVTAPICTPASLAEKATLSPGTGLPFASSTLAVALVVELPLATSEPRESKTVTCAAGPGVWVSAACPDTLGETELSVAVIVT
jgi:hypothetical protein